MHFLKTSHESAVARRDALDRYGVLDTPPEAPFDELALLAAQFCQAPIALISLLDQDQQWLKARIGLDLPQTSREVAFCEIALREPGHVLVVADTHEDPRFAQNPLVIGSPGIRFYAGAPLVTPSGIAIGTLCVLDHTPRVLSADQENALRLLARQVVAQFELRAHLVERERHQTMRRQMTHALLEREIHLQDAMGALYEGLVIQNADSEILLCNRRAEQILGLTAEQLVGRSSLDPRWKAIREDGTPLSGSEHPLPLALRTGHPQRGFIMGIETGQGERRWIEINAEPLFPPADGGSDNQRPYAGVATFRDITAQRLYQQSLVQINSQLESLVQQDSLTGLKNRRGFDEHLRNAFETTHRSKAPLALLLLDVDQFKGYNDTFGHLEGDQALRTVGQILQNAARPTDTIARYGGEEFALILPDTCQTQAQAIAQRCCQAIETHPWPHRRLTVSVGVACMQLGMASPQALVLAADSALYQAKTHGKNRAVRFVEIGEDSVSDLLESIR